jgi:hypothetical protein
MPRKRVSQLFSGALGPTQGGQEQEKVEGMENASE